MKSLIFGLLFITHFAYAAPIDDATVAFTKAKQSWEQEEYAAAITELNRAIELHDEPVFYHYLALCYAKIEQPKKALDAALEFLIRVGQKSEKTKAYGKRLSEARELVEDLRAQLKPGDVEVSVVNCAEPLITVDGQQPRAICHLQLRPQPGKSRQIKLQCPRKAESIPEPNGWSTAYPWLLGSGGAMGVAAVAAWVLRPDLNPPNTDSSKKELEDHFSSGPMGNLAIGLSISGAILLSAGGLAWFLSREEDEKAAAWLAPAPGGLVFGGSF